MKTLDQIEPRTRISALPYVITNSGSYYLDANLTTPMDPGVSAIRVLSDNVTIDLRGFSLVGTSPDDIGISLQPEAVNVTVRNGVIRSFGVGIKGAARGTVIDGVRFAGNGGAGLLGAAALVTQCTLMSNINYGLSVGAGSQIRDCVATANGSHGFNLGEGSTVADCVASFSLDGFITRNSSLVNCSAYTNLSRGFNASQGAQFVSCVAIANGVIGFSGNGEISIAKCTARANGDCGVALFKVFGHETTSIIRDSVMVNNVNYGLLAQARATVFNSTADFNRAGGMLFTEPGSVIGCMAVSNRFFGISLSANSLVQDCAVTRNGSTGIIADSGARVSGCHASFNGMDGINVRGGSTVSRCTAGGNGEDGIEATGDCSVAENHCTANGTNPATAGGGIHTTLSGNRIEGNHSVQNENGYRVDADGSTLFRNTARGNGTNWVIALGNDIGPTGAAAAATSPFANIEF